MLTEWRQTCIDCRLIMLNDSIYRGLDWLVDGSIGGPMVRGSQAPLFAALGA